MVFIDLGLSVNWADVNVGANNCEEYGKYLTFNEAKSLSFEEGVRLPSYEEMQELINLCNWEMIQGNPLKGCRVIGENGNSIFLPAGGHNSETQEYGADYWSGEPLDFGECHALHFRIGEVYTEATYKSVTQSVRLIKEK